MIDLHSLEQPLLNITELQFLHGYHEPTLMFLYEPVQTSSGYVLMSFFLFYGQNITCSIAANSLALSHPYTLWHPFKIKGENHYLPPFY